MNLRSKKLIWALLAPLAVVSCGGGGDGTGGNGNSTGSSSGGGGSGPAPKTDKIDLLLVVDNSRGMEDKQQVLSEAVPDLLAGLVNPRCIDSTSGQPVPSAQQPQGPLLECPQGSAREFPPVTDMHIGVISSSLGGHGADSCPNSETNSCNGATNTSSNDFGRLIARLDPCGGGEAQTYQNKKFLAWDPQQTKQPTPGEGSLGDLNGTPGLVPTLRDMVLGAGQIGCGYESQLESMYRFLVDPEPYQSIVIDAQGRAVPTGLDSSLLQQRVDFLRPSSLLAIVMLSDENDCSIKEFGQFYFAAQLRDPANPGKNFFLPRARSVCATNPNDPCCASCGINTPAGCSPSDQDPECQKGPYDSQGDNVNLRCWDQKRRFGIDFLYPIDRYVTGLTSPTVPNRNGQLVDNPIFSKLDPNSTDDTLRNPGLVVFAGIVGVPWQDVARDPADISKGFKTADEMNTAIPSGDGTTWDVVIGLPENNVKPKDPHMIESTDARSGSNPITGTAIAPIGSPAGANPINGHEYTVGLKNGVVVSKDDLQYACIFDLPAPRDCSSQGFVYCDCSDPTNDNPLCDVDPGSGAPTLQARAKAYPSIRELSLIKALGQQGVVASICPAQVANPAGDDYGYRPVMRSIVERLKKNLAP